MAHTFLAVLAATVLSSSLSGGLEVHRSYRALRSKGHARAGHFGVSFSLTVC